MNQNQKFGIIREDKTIITETKKREIYCIADFELAQFSPDITEDQVQVTAVNLNVILNEIEDGQVRGFTARISRELLQNWQSKSSTHQKTSFSSFLEDVKNSFACTDGFGVEVEDASIGKPILQLWKKSSRGTTSGDKVVYGTCDLKSIELTSSLSMFFNETSKSMRNYAIQAKEAKAEIAKLESKCEEADEGLEFLSKERYMFEDTLYRSFYIGLNEKKKRIKKLEARLAQAERNVSNEREESNNPPSPIPTSSNAERRRRGGARRPILIDSDTGDDSDFDVTDSPRKRAREAINLDEEHNSPPDDEDLDTTIYDAPTDVESSQSQGQEHDQELLDLGIRVANAASIFAKNSAERL